MIEAFDYKKAIEEMREWAARAGVFVILMSGDACNTPLPKYFYSFLVVLNVNRFDSDEKILFQLCHQIGHGYCGTCLTHSLTRNREKDVPRNIEDLADTSAIIMLRALGLPNAEAEYRKYKVVCSTSTMRAM